MIMRKAPPDPILKIQTIKSVGNNVIGPRYILKLTDGISEIDGFINSKYAEEVSQGVIRENTIICVNQHNTSDLQKGTLICIAECKVLGYDDSPIGNLTRVTNASQRVPLNSVPISANTSNAAGADLFIPESPQRDNTRPGGGGFNFSMSTPEQNRPRIAGLNLMDTPPVSRGLSSPATQQTPSNDDEDFSRAKIFPIMSLNPYQNNWTVRGRCSQKGQMRTWSNPRGEGKLFSFTLTDESGEIRVTAFKEVADKYFDVVQLDKVFYLRRGTIKNANKQFNPTANDYEISLNSDSKLKECVPSESREAAVALSQLPATALFNFVPIDQLSSKLNGSFVDVMGVVHEVGTLTDIQARTTQRTMTKRDLVLVDQTMMQVRLTLWQEEARNFDVYQDQHPLLVVKAAKLSDFNGCSLSVSSNSSLMVNPTHLAEALRLLGWYHSVGSSATFRAYAAGAGGSMGAGGGGNSRLLPLVELSGESSTIPEYSQACGSIIQLRRENCLYRSCAGDNCNKKVIELGESLYRCEKCQRDSPAFNWRLLLSIQIADSTSTQWVTCFNESAELILGKTSEEMGLLKSMDRQNDLDAIFDQVMFHTFVFRLRAKPETYNDESRLKVVAMEVKSVNWVDYCTLLLERINNLSQELGVGSSVASMF